MCICFIATNHPSYKLILLSNRDEVFDRATSSANWTDSTESILCPVDLGKADHGTWIAMGKNGKLAVLLNVQEPDPDELWQVSRGVFARHFVEKGNEAFDEWVSDESQARAKSGGFNLICAELEPAARSSYSLRIVSNRGPNQNFRLPSGKYCVSNAVLTDQHNTWQEWPKTRLGYELFEEYLRQYQTEEDLLDHGFDLLSTNCLSENDCRDARWDTLRKTVFVPPMDNKGHTYGTRTQTIVLVNNRYEALYVEKDTIKNKCTEFRFKLEPES